jgi:hypothetical protein
MQKAVAICSQRRITACRPTIRFFAMLLNLCYLWLHTPDALRRAKRQMVLILAAWRRRGTRRRTTLRIECHLRRWHIRAGTGAKSSYERSHAVRMSIPGRYKRRRCAYARSDKFVAVTEPVLPRRHVGVAQGSIAEHVRGAAYGRRGRYRL